MPYELDKHINHKHKSYISISKSHNKDFVLSSSPDCFFCQFTNLHKITTANTFEITGRERLIQSHSSARFSFKLSGNSS